MNTTKITNQSERWIDVENLIILAQYRLGWQKKKLETRGSNET